MLIFNYVPQGSVLLVQGSAFSLDRLVPCSYLLSFRNAVHVLFVEYDKELRAVFVSRYHKAKIACSMITSPAFEPEEAVTIYKDSNDKFIVESLEINQNIWYLISGNRMSGEQKSLSMNALGTKSHKRVISDDIGLLVCSIWRDMVNDAAIPKDESSSKKSHTMWLDGTSFRFLLDKEECGFANVFPASGRIDKLVKIGKLLHKYSKSSEQEAESVKKELQSKLIELNGLIRNSKGKD